MIRAGPVALAAAALLPVAAAAFPDGAPWDALDDPDGACASCHFGGDPVAQSDALTIEGAGGPLLPGETYALTLRFAPENAPVAGFLATFEPADGGSIVAREGLEARGASVRSVAAVPAGGAGAAWTFEWTAPAAPGRVALHIAANAANDDASPFGDVIYLKTVSFDVRQDPE